jgi:hypothetical protein
MTNNNASKGDQDYLNSFSAIDRKLAEEWLERNSTMAEQRADEWTEKGLRLVFVLNAGGVLALLTTANVWRADPVILASLVSSASIFIAGLVLAAYGTVHATVFFNSFSKKSNDLYRLAVNHDLTVRQNDDADEEISRNHTSFKRFEVGFMLVSFGVFVAGAINSLSALG